jgi:rhodanese-related sulfurtransferase
MKESTMSDLTLEEAGALAPLVDAADAVQRAKSGAVVFDVRGEKGWATGIVTGAVPIDRTTVVEDFAPDSPVRKNLIDITTPVVVVCGSVRGSGPVAAQLIELGYTNVVHVEGGASAWAAAESGETAPASADGASCAV